jgi:hypothetical protein
MKKIATLFLFAFTILLAAQAQIPNPSFETWTSYTSTYGNGEYPTSWQTTDSTYINVSFGTSGHSAIRELTDVCNGNNSIKLISVSALGNLGPGVATNGKITGISTIAGGSPTTARPLQFNGCYRYVPTGSDSGRVSALLSRWNGTAKDTIALASAVVYATPLTNFQLSFVYRDVVNLPDTILIVLASGQGLNQTTAGSYLIVDDLSTSGTLGLAENSMVKNISLYPQPAQDVLHINFSSAQISTVKYEVTDITGRVELSGKINPDNSKIDISSVNRGNYFITLQNTEGAVIYSGKFSVAK